MKDFLETAEFLGARLTRDAIWDDKRCNWFGWPVTDLSSGRAIMTHRMCGPGFADGTSGIGIFLAYLYSVTRQSAFKLTAEGAVRQALSQVDDIQPGKRHFFSNGLVGIAYALFTLAKSCEIEKFNSIGLFLLEEIQLPELDHSEIEADSISALLRIYREHHNEFILSLAMSLGERLLETRKLHSDAGTSALLDLFALTGDEELKNQIEQQLKSSDSVLNLLRAFQLLKEDRYLENAKSKLSEMTSSVLSAATDFSFGSGLMGRANLLIEASRLLSNDTHKAAAERIATFGIERYRKDNLPWPCGSINGSETPALMSGLAGIGYGYLRVFDSFRIPSLDFKVALKDSD